MSLGNVRCARCSNVVGVVTGIEPDDVEAWMDRAVEILRAHDCPTRPAHTSGPRTDARVADVRRALQRRRDHNLGMAQRIEAALALHRPDPHDPRGRRCVDCEQLYPCNTRMALSPARPKLD